MYVHHAPPLFENEYAKQERDRYKDTARRKPSEKYDSILTTLLTAARIKKNTRTKQIKFKVRCSRYLYTLVLKDTDKADKLKASLPPGLSGDAS